METKENLTLKEQENFCQQIVETGDLLEKALDAKMLEFLSNRILNSYLVEKTTKYAYVSKILRRLFLFLLLD